MSDSIRSEAVAGAPLRPNVMLACGIRFSHCSRHGPALPKCRTAHAARVFVGN